MENTVLRDGQGHRVGYNPFVLCVDQFVKCVLLERYVCIVWLNTCVYIQKESQNGSADLGSNVLSVCLTSLLANSGQTDLKTELPLWKALWIWLLVSYVNNSSKNPDRGSSLTFTDPGSVVLLWDAWNIWALVFWVSYKKAAWICCCMLACPGFTLLTNFSPPGGCLKRSCVRFFIHSLGMRWRRLFSICIVHLRSFPRMQTRKRSHLPCLSYPLIPFLHFLFLFFHLFSCSLSAPEPKCNLSFLSSCFCHIMPSGVIQSQIIFLCTSTSMAHVLRDSAPTCTYTHPSTQPANQPTLPNLPPHRHQPQMGIHGTHLPSPPAQVVGPL